VAAPPSPTALPEHPRGGPKPPFPGEWIAIGPATRERMAAVLEQQLGVVWQALLEQAGARPGQPFRLVIESASLRPEGGGEDGHLDGARPTAAQTGPRPAPAGEPAP
jgi:hypothetical protein